MAVQLFCLPNPGTLTSLQILFPKALYNIFPAYKSMYFRVCYPGNKTKTVGTKGSPMMHVLKMRFRNFTVSFLLGNGVDPHH